MKVTSPIRFATRAMLLQLGTVALVVSLCTIVFAFLGIQQLREESGAAALGIARTVAEDRTVRRIATEIASDPNSPEASPLKEGPLQSLSVSVTRRTGVLFIVIADSQGTRLAHPNSAQLGRKASSSSAKVLQGAETVDWDEGTLGESARARVPIFPVESNDLLAAERPVGFVSVGFDPKHVFAKLPQLGGSIAAVSAASLMLATCAALLTRRKLERITLGLQPEEMASLVRKQTAVLNGIREGVVGIDPSGTVRVCNESAELMLGVTHVSGHHLSELQSASDVLAVAGIQNGERRERRVFHNGKVLFVEHRPVSRNGVALGRVVIIRDRTDVIELSKRFETEQAMTGALRMQRHEFDNRIHVTAGLLDANRITEARAFLDELIDRGPVNYTLPGLETLEDLFLRSFLQAKALEASERKIQLRIAENSHLHGSVSNPEDTAAILGNLLDNAIDAASRGLAPRWVEVAVFDHRSSLVLTVADSGPGIPENFDVFSNRKRTIQPEIGNHFVRDNTDGKIDAVHGHGIGLPFSRGIARANGGDVWLMDSGISGEHGAVFAAKISGAITPLR